MNILANPGTMRRAVSFTFNTLIVFFLGLLASTLVGNSSFAQCTTTATPSTGSSCAGQAVGITASGAGAGAIYTWSPATGLSATSGAVVSAAPAVATVYTVTGINSLGCSSTATVNISVYATSPTISSIAAIEKPVCAGSSLHLDVAISSSALPYTYVWAGPGGFASSIGPTLALTNTVVVTAVSSLPVNPVYTVTVTDIHRCVVVGTATTTVNPSPGIFAVGGGGLYCAGGAGADVQLLGSETGAIYQLYSGATPIGSTVSGTGSMLDFGNHVAGIYSVTGVYSVTGCSSAMSGTATISAVSPPAAITGTLTVCAGLTTALTDATAGGTWSISGSSTAVVSAGGVGIVTGVAAGTAIVTYAATSGCTAFATVTVYPLAAISGSANICPGSTETLTDAAAGGTWASSNTGIATIGSVSGLLSGIAVGSATITYALPTGCATTLPLNVNNLPAAISGVVNICPLFSATLSDFPPGGTWSSSNTAVAVAASATGSVLGVGAGTATISYTAPDGCIATTVATVKIAPPAILQFSGLCLGYASALTDAVVGGTWSSSAPAIASVGTGGVVIGFSLGTANITYTDPSDGCIATHVVTVEPLPAAITGPLTICEGPSVTLSDATPGGTWTCSTPSVALIGVSTGIVNAVSDGVALVTYTINTGCFQTVAVTVNPLPNPISGADSICPGQTAAFFDFADGGAWSSSAPGIAMVGSISAIVTGIAAGTATITYELPTGCLVTKVITINPLPAAISGNVPVCAGGSITLASIPSGGAWTSADATIAAVGASSGIVAGVNPGTVAITYTLSSGCVATAIVTVNPSPAAISGDPNICLGLTTTLSDATSGGSWSSSFAFVASVGSTGIVTGHAVGTASISYVLPTGCLASIAVAVYGPPAPITGNLGVCAGSTTSLSDAGGGSWSSGNPAVATVAASAGVVTGNAAGTALITYTASTGCTATAVVTVNPLPLPVSGAASVCVGLTTTLSDISASGTWSSSSPAIATIGSGTGLVNGIAPGTSGITYTLTSGCTITETVTVQPLPATIGGTLHLCAGATTILSDIVAGGTWNSGAPGVASINATGTVTGVSAGTANITYTVASGCTVATIVTVNPLPAAISGTSGICAGTAATLSDASPGGTWHSSNIAVAIVGISGTVSAASAGTAEITYTLPSGCVATLVITVNPVPAPISGSLQLCVGTEIIVTDASSGGLWGIAASSSGIASVAPPSGDVSGIGPGTAAITYTLPTGCITSAVLTVNPVPAAIGGATGICEGAGAALTDASTGGTWSSSNTTQATINASTGVVTGVSNGTVIISYTLPTGCITTRAFTVNPLPGTILGNMRVCIGVSSTLTDASAGGTWSLPPAMHDSIGSSSGIITADSAGTVTVTYTLPTGCRITTIVTANPLPSVILADSFPICQGFDITLIDTTAGGTWSSANPSIATVIPTTGIVAGVSAGTVDISYTLSTGCGVAAVVTVNPIFPISGSRNVCLGVTNTLSDLAGGGTWSSGTPSVAAINTLTGAITGIASGATYITYHLGTGCMTTTTVTVNLAPFSFDVTGGGSYCSGGTGVAIGLNGSGIGISYQLVYLSSVVGGQFGTDSALDFGSFTLPGSYTVLATDSMTGCTNVMTGSATVTVNPPVTPFVSISASGGTIICAGSIADFTALTVNGGTTPLYQWSVNGTITGSGPAYSYVPLSGDVVSVKLISDASCVFPDSAMASITMTAVAGLLPSVNIFATPGDSVCPGSPVTLIPLPGFGGTSPTYDWVKNGIDVGSGPVYTFLPVNGDNVFCKMHADISCALEDPVPSNNINMSVPVINVPVVTIAAYPGTRIESGDTVTLVASVSFSGPFSYQWEINSAAIPGATTDTFKSSLFNNLDIVSCIVTGASLCGSASRSAQVTIVDTIALGVQGVQPAIDDIMLVPNPNNGAFTIKGASSEYGDMNIVVTDVLGQVVYTRSAHLVNGRINEQVKLGATIANGMYTLELISAATSKQILFVVGR